VLSDIAEAQVGRNEQDAQDIQDDLSLLTSGSILPILSILFNL